MALGPVSTLGPRPSGRRAHHRKSKWRTVPKTPSIWPLSMSPGLDIPLETVANEEGFLGSNRQAYSSGTPSAGWGRAGPDPVTNPKKTALPDLPSSLPGTGSRIPEQSIIAYLPNNPTSDND